MKTEKDIRRFIQDNGIIIPKDDAFMNDLIRQINLLPEPASFKEDSLAENLRLVRLIRAALKKRARKQALNTLVSIIFLSGLLMTGIYFLPSSDGSVVMEFIHTWRYALLGAVCLLTLAVSLSRTDLFRI